MKCRKNKKKSDKLCNCGSIGKPYRKQCKYVVYGGKSLENCNIKQNVC